MSENISDDEIDEELNIENKQTEINFNFDEIQPQDFILLNDTIPTATATLKCFDDHLKQFGEYSGNTINVDTTDCSFNSDIGSDSTIYELKLKLQSLLENDYETFVFDRLSLFFFLLFFFFLVMKIYYKSGLIIKLITRLMNQE